ncbi:hypothetical protein LS70_003845 [Helicobacter sp. MIT 11-5569]|uniref:phage adaptor protein n=1 Tax=Helicobacter sp. MIT 11-5569 TaxID=1548151 RepID=UPI00051FEA75|nr:hypothetical protein [Helicobacter sp. MIT 11-5569]TLD83951.1 hypothetical protein LS70_003845 [Helicobacter sp. MIT 11-5569]
MRAEDIILRVRTRLRDSNFESLRFSDNELLDYLLSAQNDLIFAFNLNLETLHFELSSAESFKLPSNLLNLLCVRLNGVDIPLKSYSFLLKTPHSGLCVYQKSGNLYAFNTKVSGKLSVVANFGEESLDLEDTLLLPVLFADAATYGTIKRALQVETNEANLQRVAFYENIYKQELQTLRAKLNAQRERKNIKTPTIKV